MRTAAIRRVCLALAAWGVAPAAQACSGGFTTTYFSYEASSPPRGYVTLQVRVVAGDREAQRFEATLEPPFDRLEPGGRILVAAGPHGGGSCTDLGPIDGAVMVSGRLVRERSGRLVLVAIPVPWRPALIPPADHCRYIVDPDLRPALCADRKARN